MPNFQNKKRIAIALFITENKLLTFSNPTPDHSPDPTNLEFERPVGWMEDISKLRPVRILCKTEDD